MKIGKVDSNKKNRAGWPGFSSVELRCGYITARRKPDAEREAGPFCDQILVSPDHRVSHRTGETNKQVLEVQTECHDMFSSVAPHQVV